MFVDGRVGNGSWGVGGFALSGLVCVLYYSLFLWVLLESGFVLDNLIWKLLRTMIEVGRYLK